MSTVPSVLRITPRDRLAAELSDTIATCLESFGTPELQISPAATIATQLVMQLLDQHQWQPPEAKEVANGAA